MSGSPEFFKRAFGADKDEFASLLLLPHRFIFNRTWYEELGGKAELEDFNKAFEKLSDNDKEDLKDALSEKVGQQIVSALADSDNEKIRKLKDFYSTHTDEENREIWDEQKRYRKQLAQENPNLVDDEKVEDAGLEAA